MKLILASASPRRYELLKLITEDFAVIPSKTEENIEGKISPVERVKILAERKALEVSRNDPEALVIGVDTLVFLGDIPLGKPKDENNAKEMLKALSGKTHSVITGVALARGGKTISLFAEETKVEFYPLSESEIDDYVKTGEPEGKAGAYAVQGKAAVFVKGIYGNYHNVVGLPTSALYRELKRIGALNGDK